MRDGDGDFGMGDDYADIEFDDDDDGARGVAAVMCRLVESLAVKFSWYDSVDFAMAAAAGTSCGVDGCQGLHSVAFVDDRGRIRTVAAPGHDQLARQLHTEWLTSRLTYKRRYEVERKRRNRARQRQKEGKE